MFRPFETPSLINVLQPQLYHLFSHDGPMYCVLNLIAICFNSLMHDDKGALTSGCLLKQKKLQTQLKEKDDALKEKQEALELKCREVHM